MNLHEKMFVLMDTCKHQLEMLKVQTQQREDTMSHSTTLTIYHKTKWICCFKKWQMKLALMSNATTTGSVGSIGTSVASMEQDEL